MWEKKALQIQEISTQSKVCRLIERLGNIGLLLHISVNELHVCPKWRSVSQNLDDANTSQFTVYAYDSIEYNA